MNPWLPLGAVIIAVAVAPRWRRLQRQRRATALIIDALPDLVEMLVVLVRSGLSPALAADLLAERAPPPWRPAFCEIRARRHRGQRLVDALDALPDLLGPTGQCVLDALAASERYGQPLLPSLERLAADGRAARRRRHEERARQLPVRLSIPLVLCTLPAFVLLTIVPLLGGTALFLTPLRGPR